MDSITLTWPGGEHSFALRLGELRKMQESCGAGPEQVLERLQTGKWLVNDLIEPIRLGLIGSDEKPTKDAGPLVTSLMDQHPLMSFRFVAMAILAHALYGPEDDQPGELEGETPPPENGDSAPSTETAPSSDGPQTK